MRSSIQSNLNEALHQFDDVMSEIPEARKRALEAAAAVVKAELDRQIEIRLPNKDRAGRVRRWQEVTFGSRGGYARIAAKDEPVRTSCDVYSSRDITFWLERGHVVGERKKTALKGGSKRRGRTKDYVSVESESTGKRIVTGKLMYSWTQFHAQREVRKAAENVLKRIAEQLENFS